MISPNAQNHNQDLQRLDEFVRSFKAGNHIASQFIPRIMAGSTSYDEAMKVIDDRLHGSSEQQFAGLLLSLPDLLQSAKAATRDNIRVVSKGHTALKEIMLDAEGTPITQRQLVSGCMRFAQTNLVSTSADDLVTLENKIQVELIGMWNEQSFTNFLCAGDIISADATNSEDLGGIDVFVKVSDQNLWVPIDVKASDAGIERALDKKHVAAKDLTYLQGNSQFRDRSYFAAQPDNPAVALAATSKRVFVHLMVGPHSSLLAPMDFRGSSAHETVDGFQKYIDKLASSGFDTHSQTTTESGSTIFAPTRILRKVGKTATVGKA